MIPFFRKFRRQLATDNKFLNYSRYAIGEIVLVVIGILIALQVNDWNDNRKSKIREHMYLKKLHEDVQNMQDLYSKRMGMAQDNLEIALTGLKYVQNCLPDPSQERYLDTLLYGHQALPNLYVIRDTYEEMLAANVLANLSNRELKSEITSFYTRAETFNSYIEYFRTDLGRASSIVWKHVTFGYDQKNELTVSYDFENLCGAGEFRNALVEVVDSREDYLSVAQEALVLVGALNESLQAALEKHPE